MPNLNLRLDEEAYWAFKEAKAQLKAKTNEEALRKLVAFYKRGRKGL